MAPGRSAVRSLITAFVFGVIAAGIACDVAGAHAGLLRSSPVAGATLGAAPEAVQLSFSEQPQPSLSTIRVLGPRGAPVQIGSPVRGNGDPLSLAVPMRP